MMPNAPFQIGEGEIALGALAVLADSGLKVTLLLIAAAALGLALRRASAARRHLVWTVAVGATLATPLLSAATPDLAVSIPGLRLPVTDPPSGPVPQGAALTESVAGDAAGPEDADEVRERTYEAAGIGERERRESLGALAEWMELRAGSADIRLDGLEERVAALELRAEHAGASSGKSRESPTGVPERTLDPPRVAAGASAGGVGDVEGGRSAYERRVGGDRTGAVAAAAGGEARRDRARSPAAALLGIWAAGFLLGAGALLLGVLRLAWIRRRATPITKGPVAEAAARVAERLDLDRRPLLLQGDDTAMPMTWGLFRATVLLPAGAEGWEAWRREAVLLHEFAHVARRDYLAQFAAHLACALYWFHPLVWIAAHRLRVEREHACDDVVVSAGTDAPDYARGLIEIARTLRVGRTAAGAAALAMARPHRLRDRLQALLDDRRDRSPLTRRRAAGAWGLGLALVLPMAALTPVTGQGTAAASVAGASASESPAAPEPEVSNPAVEGDARGAGGDLPLPATREQAPSPSPARIQEATALCGSADGALERSSHRRDDDRTVIETRYGDCTTSIRLEGDVRFDEDFDAVATLSPDGFMRLEVSRDGERRRMEIRPGPDGRPEIRWWVDGRERALDAEAERWLETALVDLFRTTGYKAEERVAYLLEQEGPEGVFAEVARMRSDHPRARYLQALLEREGLSAEQVRRAMEIGAREIDSDHWLAGILSAAAERYDFDATTRATFIRAAGSLDSDHHQANVLTTALERDDLSRENLRALLEQAAEGIESDHHVANILTRLAARYPLEPGLREPFLRAAASLESDHHRANVYGIVLDQEGLSAAELAEVLAAARRIESDHHLAGVLIRVSEGGLSEPVLQRAYLDAASALESDHHRARVLSALVDRDDLGADELALALRAGRAIESDHHLANFLIRVASTHELEGEVRDEFTRTLEEVDSEHHHGRVASLLLRRGG